MIDIPFMDRDSVVTKFSLHSLDIEAQRKVPDIVETKFPGSMVQFSKPFKKTIKLDHAINPSKSGRLVETAEGVLFIHCKKHEQDEQSVTNNQILAHIE